MPGSKQMENMPQLINLDEKKRKRVTGDTATGLSIKQTKLVLELFTWSLRISNRSLSGTASRSLPFNHRW